MALSEQSPHLARLLAHHDDLSDARSGEDVDRETKLVARYQPRGSGENDHVLKNLVGIVKPSEPCTLILEDGSTFESASKTDGYHLSVTFNNLWAAPAIRLACVWNLRSNTGVEFLFTLAIEFYFKPDNDIAGIGETFKVARRVHVGGSFKDEMSFTSRGAVPCTGFNRLEEYGTRLGMRGTQLADALRSLIKPEAPQKIRIRFSTLASTLPTLLRYLPDGNGPLLPTFSEPDWSMYRRRGTDAPEIRSPYELMNMKVPDLWLAQESLNTFTSLLQAAIELQISAYYAHVEQEQALEMWAETQHSGIPYFIGNVAFMVVKFGSFEKLLGAQGNVKFQLPENLDVVMKWKDSRTSKWMECPARLSSVPVSIPGDHDAIFTMRPKLLKSFLNICYDPDKGIGEQSLVTFDPHFSKFTLQSQMYTAQRIVSEGTKPWHPFILNQLYDELEWVDIAKAQVPGYDDPTLNVQVEGTQERLRDAHIRENFEWLKHWRKWNAEQLQAIESIRYAKGGMSIVTGPAATGKTLVQLAICAFFYRLGFHVILLAPANTNIDDLMKKLEEYFPDICATRIFPGSTNYALKDVNQNIEARKLPGHINGAMASIHDYELLRRERAEDKHGNFRNHGLQEQVLDAALKGIYQLWECQRDEKGFLTTKKVDQWAVLKDCMDTNEAGDFDWDNDASEREYTRSYNACVAHYVSMSRFIVTTTGNVRCSEIIGNFAQEKHGTTCRGIFYMLDEAFKGQEIDSLAAPLCKEFEGKGVGMMMLGDEKQLAPTNKSSGSNVTFNPFPQRQSISWPSRLVHEGFPHVKLVEQRRMNPHISEWPSKHFYSSEMRDGPGMVAELKDTASGLHDCFLQFFRDHTGDENLTLDDGALRTHYLEIVGKRLPGPDGCSKKVLEHIQVFFSSIFWYLHKYYGEAMEQNVMIIVAYRESRRCWRQAALCIQNKFKLTDKEMPTVSFLPKVNTIDSSQGQEAPVVFLDCSVQNAEKLFRDLGFVDNKKRMNVAMTRAKEVFYVLGGPCEGVLNYVDNPPAYIAYKKHLESKHRCLKMSNQKIAEGSDWLSKITKKEVTLTTRYYDDVRERQER